MGKQVKVDEPITVQTSIAAELSCETRTDAGENECVLQLFVPASLKVGSDAVFYRESLTSADTTSDLSAYTDDVTYPFIFVGDKTILHLGAEFSTNNGAAIFVPVLYYDNDATAILGTLRSMSFSAGYYKRSDSGKYISPAQEVMVGAAKYVRVLVKYLQTGATLDVVAGAR